MSITKDLEDVKALGLDVEKISNQLSRFQDGFPFLKLKEAATISRGIIQVDEGRKTFYKKKSEDYSGVKVKFVPASGAATRMFKSLYEAKSLFENEVSIADVFAKYPDIKSFFDNLQKFAFYGDLDALSGVVSSIRDEGLSEQKCLKVLDLVLFEDGLNYGNLPKGLLKFHCYGNGTRSAAAEHLAEGVAYAKDLTGNVRIHFTVSPQHLQLFEKEVEHAVKEFAGKATFSIDYSVQKKETDTIAVNMDNTPFRDSNGKLVFRPAGHGALLENLNEIDSDIIFIKNIDNVVPDQLKAETVEYKKIIAGILIDIQEKAFSILKAIDSGEYEGVEAMAEELLANICESDVSLSSLDLQERIRYVKEVLNRPVRVCGMVKNQGEPGGGPFIAENAAGRSSLQIVESSQIDLKNAEQKAVFEKATHFNPVDLVCGVKDYKGNKFDLRLFSDPKTGFISVKSKDGRDLKAMELPGLWNGAMSNWITLFVEVPLITFNPVKTVNDLLRPEHQ